MKEQVTKEFSVIHATVHYSDNTTENVSYVEKYRRDGYIEIQDIDDEWEAFYSRHNDGPCLYYGVDPESTKIISMANVKKIENNWVEELVAVAEVELIEESYGFLGRNTTYSVKDNTPDTTVWEKIEWEAFDEEEES